MAYGNKTVIGHHYSQEEIVTIHEYGNKIHLCETPRGDGLTPKYVVDQHLGNSGEEADVHKEQDAKKEVHRSV